MLTFDPSIRPTAEVGWVRMGQIERFIISFPMKSHPFWWVPEMGVTPKSSHSLDNFSKPMVLGTPTFENSHFLVLFAAVRRCWWVHGWSSRRGAEAQKGGNQANPTVFSLVKSICLEIEDNILAPFNYQMLADVWHGLLDPIWNPEAMNFSWWYLAWSQDLIWNAEAVPWILGVIDFEPIPALWNAQGTPKSTPLSKDFVTRHGLGVGSCLKVGQKWISATNLEINGQGIGISSNFCVIYTFF